MMMGATTTAQATKVIAYLTSNLDKFSKVFKSGYEALNLAFKFGISVEKIPEFIIQGKKTIEELERQRQELI